LPPAKRYTPDHEVIKFDDESGIGTVSITDYAQKSLGDVVFVELPETGTTFKQGGKQLLSFFFSNPISHPITLQSLLVPLRALKRPQISFVQAEALRTTLSLAQTYHFSLPPFLGRFSPSMMSWEINRLS
jgi:Glycine cleavage H-protein